jgi:uncharacterized phage protein (TIGR01671 family)
MRQLKFRAWNSIVERMSDPHTLEELHKEDVQFWNLTFMQYTGLKDKNGVEIYEGDYIYDHIGHGVIEYAEKYAAFRVNYRDDRCKWFYDYLDSEQASIEVIGNIYTDKELLG